jgi:NADPH-dependent 2,4-dienoyl-CoA reductase/sulfur reductase-like enzyme
VRRRHIAVVGASLGGLRTVEALRRLGCADRITLIGAEASLPYDRPPLSKDVLLGKADAESVNLTTTVDLAALDVDVLLSTPALGLDLAQRTLTLGGAHTGRLPFDDLVIATGASARRPFGLGGHVGVHTLRTLDDALAIRSAFEQGARVSILGGGFIGAEVASSARALGLDATIVDLAPVLMQRGLGDVIGARMTAVARAAGVSLALGTSVDEVLGTDRVEAVLLLDGTVIETDLLVLGLGASANTDWLADSGLKIDDGVVCDAHLRAAPGVYAVGDVARWAHPVYGSIRCEHWTTTGEHADAVAATLTGTPTASAEVPYVWSDQFDHKVQIAGLIGPGDEVSFVVEGSDKFVAVAGSNGRQTAAFALDAPGALIRQRMKLAGSPPWPPEMG